MQLTDTTRAAIDAALRVRYVRGGRDLDGWDCWGAVRWLYAQRTGLWLPEYPAVSRDTPHAMQQLAKRHWHNLAPCGFVPWALACQFQGRVWTHVGLVLPDRTVLHASGQLGRTTTHRRRDFERLSLDTRYFHWITDGDPDCLPQCGGSD